MVKTINKGEISKNTKINLTKNNNFYSGSINI